MKYEKEKALLRKTAEIIQNYEKRMNDLTGLEKKLDTDVGNEIVEKSEKARKKVQTMKNEQLSLYLKAFEIKEIIMKLDTLYSHILEEIYFNGKMEKEIEAYKGCSRSTTNRYHNKALELLKNECIKRGIEF